MNESEEEEQRRFIKDESRYLVFACAQCGHYSYVKASQKTKKCLRCGRMHQVKNIKESETALGITAALSMVKSKQAELALEELGHHPDLLGFNTFKIPESQLKKISRSGSAPSGSGGDHQEAAFSSIMKQVSLISPTFPEHSITLLAPEYGILEEEIPILIARCIENGTLKRMKNGYLKLMGEGR